MLSANKPLFVFFFKSVHNEILINNTVYYDLQANIPSNIKNEIFYKFSLWKYKDGSFVKSEDP